MKDRKLETQRVITKYGTRYGDSIVQTTNSKEVMKIIVVSKICRQWHAGSIPAPGTINYIRSVMTIDEQLEILLAAKEGKEIEYCIYNNWHTFRDAKIHRFNFDEYKYRIKKQTKKVYLFVIKSQDNKISNTFNYYSDKQEVLKKYPNFTIIKRLDYTELEINE